MTTVTETKIEKLALALCYQIEKCGASEELTKASVMASELRREILLHLQKNESVKE